MASAVGDHAETGTSIALVRLRPAARADGREQPTASSDSTPASPTGVSDRVAPLLTAAHARSAGRSQAGDGDAADASPRSSYAADVILALAAEGELDAADTVSRPRPRTGARRAVPPRRSISTCERSRARRCSSCRPSSPPRSSCGCSSTSVAPRPPSGVARAAPGRMHPLARGRHGVTADPRHGQGAITGRAACRSSAARTCVPPRSGASASRSAPSSCASLGDPAATRRLPRRAAAALSPVLERELLLERNAAPRAHAGRVGREPADAARLRSPRRPDPGRPRPRRRDAASCSSSCTRSCSRATASSPTAASTTSGPGSTELDRALARSRTRSRRRASSPGRSAEILHREVDAFAERTGIERVLEVRGDPESLSSAQRIAVFRAVQESLANVREHSGATAVEVRIRARRSTIDVGSPTTARASRCPRAGAGRPARPTRSRRHRRARPHARRHVRARQPARRPDDALFLPPTLGAAALTKKRGGLAPSPLSSAPPRAEEFRAPPLPPSACAPGNLFRARGRMWAVHQEDAMSTIKLASPLVRAL